jgi:hypothetical protein
MIPEAPPDPSRLNVVSGEEPRQDRRDGHHHQETEQPDEVCGVNEHQDRGRDQRPHDQTAKQERKFSAIDLARHAPHGKQREQQRGRQDRPWRKDRIDHDQEGDGEQVEPHPDRRLTSSTGGDDQHNERQGAPTRKVRHVPIPSKVFDPNPLPRAAPRI